MIKLRKDRFSRTRGGNSKLITIFCAKCNSEILNYQKDGIGSLRRLYVDRIQKEVVGNDLRCINCKNLIGVLTIYKKENRSAYRLINGSFMKKNGLI